MKKLSLIASGLLLTSSLAFATDSIDNAFKNGKVSGNITAYGISTDNKTSADTDAAYLTTGLSFETATFNNLSVKTSFIAGTDYDDAALVNNSLLTEANVTYAVEGLSVTVGRQAIDLEWLGDYNEAVVAAITSVPNTTIVAGFTDRKTAADEDEIGSFTKVNSNEGAYVLDVKYSGIANVELNPYYYSAEDTADFYGLKATYSSDLVGLTAQYATSNEDTGADGSISTISVSKDISGVSLTAGLVNIDKDGIGSITAFGDNSNPFDTGTNVYTADADTTYASVSTTVNGVDLGAVYGEVEYGTSKDKELNLTASYSYSDSLSISALYADVNDEGSADSSYVSATLAYSF